MLKVHHFIKLHSDIQYSSYRFLLNFLYMNLNTLFTLVYPSNCRFTRDNRTMKSVIFGFGNGNLIRGEGKCHLVTVSSSVTQQERLSRERKVNTNMQY